MRWIKKHYISLTTILLPITIMGILFIFMGLYPFGDESLLTTDLGMQYIDFFSQFRHTLLHNPQSLLYSFGKSIGGEMTGIWAYYLMSPFNLIFLLFPNQYLNVAVSLIVLLKYGFAGFTMGYYLKKSFPVKFPLLLTCSTSYALMGYMVCYHFNLMWTDAIILLPLVALGIDRIIRGEGYRTYLFSLFITLWSNFYIGYMICIFSVIYFLYRLFEQENHSLRYYGKCIRTFALSSLAAAGLAAVLLLPTLMQLLASKGSYADNSLLWTSDYPLADLLAKFVVGAFNFDQLPDGMPNVFVASIMLILVAAFFFNRKFTLKQKCLTALVIILLLLSLNISALNKIWHVFQFPVWFPYRFSFVFSFFIIVIAYRSGLFFTQFKKWQALLLTAMVLMTAYYLYQQDFDFLEPYQIIISTALALIYIISMTVTFKKTVVTVILLLLTTAEITTNAVLSVNALGYIDHSKYTNGVTILNSVMNDVKENVVDDESFYRINKTFQRSKDDAQQFDYHGATHFGSTYQSDVIKLFSKLGFPAFSGYSTYSSSSLITDALFSMRYHISDNSVNRLDYFLVNSDTEEANFPSAKVSGLLEQDTLEDYFALVQFSPDLHYYTLEKNYEDTIYAFENPYALPLIFTANDNIMSIDYNDYSNPLLLQNDIMASLIGDPSLELFDFVDTSQQLENAEIVNSDGHLEVRPKIAEEPAYIQYNFKNNQSDAYYLTLDEANDVDNMEIDVNGRKINQTDSFHDPLVLNVAGRSHNDETTVRFEILNDEPFIIDNLMVYQLNFTLFENVIARTRAQDTVSNLEVTDSHIQFDVDISEDNSMLFTSIPYDEGWRITANGKTIEAVEVLDSLMGIKLPQGHYTISLKYQPPLLMVGASISIITLLLIFILWRKERKKKKKFYY